MENLLGWFLPSLQGNPWWQDQRSRDRDGPKKKTISSLNVKAEIPIYLGQISQCWQGWRGVARVVGRGGITVWRKTIPSPACSYFMGIGNENPHTHILPLWYDSVVSWSLSWAFIAKKSSSRADIWNNQVKKLGISTHQNISNASSFPTPISDSQELVNPCFRSLATSNFLGMMRLSITLSREMSLSLWLPSLVLWFPTLIQMRPISAEITLSLGFLDRFQPSGERVHANWTSHQKSAELSDYETCREYMCMLHDHEPIFLYYVEGLEPLM